MNQSESKQPLLEGQQYGEPVYYLPPRKSTFKFYHVFVTVIVLLSLTGNVVLVYQQHSLLTQPEQCRSKYSISTHFGLNHAVIVLTLCSWPTSRSTLGI